MQPIFIDMGNRKRREWGKGVIVPILKGGVLGEKVFDPGSYRGITLLNTVLKLFTGVISERLHGFARVRIFYQRNRQVLEGRDQ